MGLGTSASVGFGASEPALRWEPVRLWEDVLVVANGIVGQRKRRLGKEKPQITKIWKLRKHEAIRNLRTKKNLRQENADLHSWEIYIHQW